MLWSPKSNHWRRRYVFLGIMFSLDTLLLTDRLTTQLARLDERSGRPTLNALRKRVDHVRQLEQISSLHSMEYKQWTETRLDRWLVDWMLRNGKPETSKALAKEKGIEVCLNLIERIKSCWHVLGFCGYRDLCGNSQDWGGSQKSFMYGGISMVQREQNHFEKVESRSENDLLGPRTYEIHSQRWNLSFDCKNTSNLLERGNTKKLWPTSANTSLNGKTRRRASLSTAPLSYTPHPLRRTKPTGCASDIH